MEKFRPEEWERDKKLKHDMDVRGRQPKLAGFVQNIIVQKRQALRDRLGIPPRVWYFARVCMTAFSTYLVYELLSVRVIVSILTVTIVYLLLRYGTEIYRTYRQGEVQISAHKHDLLKTEIFLNAQIASDKIEDQKEKQKIKGEIEALAIKSEVRKLKIVKKAIRN